tara:strand:+ start:74 stop:508 length:435 start_codon:yes stop_codon:yes gene_type:complete
MIGKKINEIWTVGTYRQLFPTTSFAGVPSTTWLSENECYDVVRTLPYDKKTQNLVSIDPILKDGKVYIVEVKEKTDAEKTAWTEKVSSDVRTRRNELLLKSDWTQVSDFTHPKKSEWGTYRQKLRDLPSESGFPYIDLPTEPSA